MTISIFSVPPKDLTDLRKFCRVLSTSVGQIVTGKTNNVLDVTLNANSGSTNVVDRRIGVNTVAVCIPVNSSGAAISLPYRDFSSSVNGQMTLIHANDAVVDKTFKVILVG